MQPTSDSASSDTAVFQSRRFHRGLLLGVLLALSALGGVAAVRLRPPDPTEPLRVRPPVADLGRLKQLEVVETVFTIENLSEDPVTITDVSSSCGCMAPVWEYKKIAARSSAELPVRFSAGRSNGLVERLVRLYVADADAPGGRRMIELPLTATVRPDYELSTERLDFGVVPAAGPIEKTVTITRAGMDQPLRVFGVRSTHDSVSASVRPVAGRAEDVWELTLRLTPSLYPNEVYSGEVTFQTNSGAVPNGSVAVYAQIDRRFTVRPRSVFFTVSDDTPNRLSRQVRITPQGDRLDGHVTLHCDERLFGTRVAGTDAHGALTIQIAVDTAAISGDFEENLRIEIVGDTTTQCVVPVWLVDMRTSHPPASKGGF